MLSADTYNLWFAPLHPVSQTDGILTLEVANDFCEVWLKDNYMGLLQDVVALAAGRQLQVKFKVSSAPNSAPSAAPPAPAKSKATEAAVERNSHPVDLGFNPKNTFDTFVVGNNNNFAYAAALAVAQAPGKSYNPLFFYGGVGLGKTHLLHAIGQHVSGQRKAPAWPICRRKNLPTNTSTASKTTNSSGSAKIPPDGRVVDRRRPVSGRQGTDPGGVFPHLQRPARGAQANRVDMRPPAGEIQNLEQRLVSRFEWGLVTEMQPPDVETRMAILSKKEKAMGVELPDDIINFLANRIRTNIRRLEGALIRVASFASLTGKKLTLRVVEGLLREVLHEEGRYTVNIDVIQKKVAEHFDIRLADMTSKRRPENIAFPAAGGHVSFPANDRKFAQYHWRGLWRARPRHRPARLPPGQGPHGS